MSNTPSSTTSVNFRVPFPRRIPDPNFRDRGAERHVWFMRARDVPEGLPTDPNARETNINKRVYRALDDSLMNVDVEPGTFHLKHKGITIVADRVESIGEDQYRVVMHEGQGILDGGHTYELLTLDRDTEIPDDQYVKLEILVGVPPDWIPQLSAGLNTSVQVQPMSIDNLDNLFEWIKDELRPKPYFSELAWKENAEGIYDARDLVGMMTLFNIHYFPDGDTHPLEGYKYKAAALKRYEQDQKDGTNSYQRLRPILHDILVLHDTISYEARDLYNTNTDGRAGSLAFVEHRERKPYDFPFIEQQGTYRLMGGALYPWLAAFRWMVEEDPNSPNYRWRGGFDRVLEIFRETAPAMMKLTKQTSADLRYNVNALGKSKSHWGALYSKVSNADLMARLTADA